MNIQEINVLIEKLLTKTKFKDKVSINVDENKGVLSEKFGSIIVFSITLAKKNTYKIKCKYDIFDYEKEVTSKNKFVIYNLDNETDFIDHVNLLFSNIDRYIYDVYVAEPYGCCEKYLKCSDARTCLHDDELHSKGCMYNKNLKQGKIFYGVNTNIKH